MSLPLNSNDCLMKDVTGLICSGVVGLSIFVSFSSWFNSRKFQYMYFESIGIKCFEYWYFSCIQRKNEIHLPRHCKSHMYNNSLWSLGILRFLPISIENLCSLSLNFVKINLTFLSGCDK